MTRSTPDAFDGFSREGLEFLARLGEDNRREVFEAHRQTYESALLEPCKRFVVSLGAELRDRVSPGIRAEPRVNGSILRITRDLRFTADKRPYKDHLDLWFWEGDAPSRERPGYVVRLRADTVALGAGMYRFGPETLSAYRAAVADERSGTALEEALAQATALRGVSVGGVAYRRAPRGMATDHPRADLLRHGALHVSGEWPLPRAAGRGGFVGWAADRLERMAPVERWLTATLFGPS